MIGKFIYYFRFGDRHYLSPKSAEIFEHPLIVNEELNLDHISYAVIYDTNHTTRFNLEHPKIIVNELDFKFKNADSQIECNNIRILQFSNKNEIITTKLSLTHMEIEEIESFCYADAVKVYALRRPARLIS